MVDKEKLLIKDHKVEMPPDGQIEVMTAAILFNAGLSCRWSTTQFSREEVLTPQDLRAHSFVAYRVEKLRRTGKEIICAGPAALEHGSILSVSISDESVACLGIWTASNPELQEVDMEAVEPFIIT